MPWLPGIDRMGFDAVALVSGGKDSVMAAMMAQSYGHNIVALANLLPADGDVEELDSALLPDGGPQGGGCVPRTDRFASVPS